MNSYASQLDIPLDVFINSNLDYREFLERHLEIMRQDGAIKVFDEIYKCGYPVVVETHMETWTEGYIQKYRLHYRLTAVQSRYVTMPVFIYTNHEGKVEWKCSYCKTINSIEATFCGEKHTNAVGCGHPRDEARQEMYA